MLVQALPQPSELILEKLCSNTVHSHSLIKVREFVVPWKYKVDALEWKSRLGRAF